MHAGHVVELVRLRREVLYEGRRVRRIHAMHYVATAPRVPPQRGHEAEPRAAT